MQFSYFDWVQTEDVLTPALCLIQKAQFETLNTRLLKYSDQRLSELRGVWNHSFVVLIGEESALPWLEQVSYYGNHPHSPHLYTPTQLVCSLSHDIVQRLVLAQYGNGNYVLDPEEKRIIPLHQARIVDREFLLSFTNDDGTCEP